MNRTPRPVRPPRAKTFRALAVLAVLTVMGGAIAPWAYSTFVDTSAKDRIAAAPPPTLFPDATIAPIAQRIDQQQTTAHRLMSTWWTGHDATAADAAFVTWLEANLPGPPSPTLRDAEIHQVQQIAPTRTSAGVAAATWLEAYGKKDVWKLAAHDQAELVPVGEGEAIKNDVDAMLSMSKTVADALGAKYQQSAPYVIDPTLRTDHTVAPGDVCPCSYPSRHATSGAASATYLASLYPHRADDYHWMQDEIAWSRIYMAGHVTSDITGGTLLGDMIGQYFLITRNHEPVPAT